MMFKNPNSKRENPFRNIYDNEEFKTILQHKGNLVEFPFLVDVELTNYCNLKCIFCGQQAMKRNKGFMSKEILNKIVDECFKYKTPIRFIRWGEPFLHPNIIGFLKYIKSKKILAHVTTNGLAMKEGDMRTLVEIGLDSLIFSFQGATKEQYEIMRNNHRYDELKANILKMIEMRGDRPKPFIHISSTMTNESEKEIDKFVKYWGNIVDSIGIGKTNLSRLSSNQINSFETIDKLEYLKKQETIKKYYRPCAEVYQKLSVDWNGKVSCCCADYNNFMTVGDINNSTLYDIWNTSRKLKTFRNMLDKGMHKSLTLCSTCYHIYEEF